jgi:hypothetical protein
VRAGRLLLEEVEIEQAGIVGEHLGRRLVRKSHPPLQDPHLRVLVVLDEGLGPEVVDDLSIITNKSFPPGANAKSLNLLVLPK